MVGQGLAGTVLALTLMERNYTVKVIDEPLRSACSKVAAGIWNPVVFKRLTKSWMADELLPAMKAFYQRQERSLGKQLITERSIIKFFGEGQEAELWRKKASGELSAYLDPQVRHEPLAGVLQGKEGYARVRASGNLNVKLFLETARELLKQKDNYLKETFDHAQLEIGDAVKYKGIIADRIIFAEGHLIRQNPYFNYIPMKPAKGETLTLAIDGLSTGSDILNRNAFLMETDQGIYKAGATYNWEDTTDEPTPQGLQELEQKLRRITQVDYRIIRHEAGVRPSVSDRRPVLGRHPRYENLYIFNGMGTKGVMLAPWMAGHFAAWLGGDGPLLAEVDVSRFNHLLNR